MPLQTSASVRHARGLRHSAVPSERAKDKALRKPLRSFVRAPDEAAAASPSLRATAPGFSARSAKVFRIVALDVLASGPSSHCNDERLAAFHCRPRVVGKHRNAVGDLHDLLHARERLSPLPRRSSSLFRRKPGHRCRRRIQHSRNFHIDAKRRFAADLRRRVHALLRFADQLELRRIFQCDTCCGTGNFDAASARLP